MKARPGLILVCVFLLPAAFAGGSTNQYSAIERRNVFSLRAAPVQASPPPASAAPAQIKLAGIAALLPQKWAILQIRETGKSAKSVMLKEGMRESTVEVVEIDAGVKWVKVLNNGLLMTLTFANDGLQSSSSLLASAGPDPNHVPLELLPSTGAGEP